ncbi:MAG: glycosyltransferase [Desulfobacterales bacterium]|uniref:Glycosyltransferase n=1 Tax=Candidatus Desulfatibia vada TaxID=2841696 RepID=A0A8J6NV46_9BACT|nr:glycosyltransferase [Candidatus Desulfatibia vada]
MRCPVLKELPPSPQGKTGWPWTKESPQLPDNMPYGSPWPKISIVTPSLNQGHFIEETIRSVLLQGYPKLEYIIIDGGSVDESVKIIKKYEKWIAYWVSEKDKGQSQAINKGFKKCTGEIVAWLNSDDLYCKNTLSIIGHKFRTKSNMCLLYGDCIFINGDGNALRSVCSRDFQKNQIIDLNFIFQPSAFIKKSVVSELYYLDEKLNFAMDFDLWIRILKRYPSVYLPISLSMFRWHDDSKTMKKGLGFLLEDLYIAVKHSPEYFSDIAETIMSRYANDKGYPLDELYFEMKKTAYTKKDYRNLYQSLNKIENRILSKSYVDKADIAYNQLDLIVARKHFLNAIRLFKGRAISKEFLRLLPRVFLPRPLVQLARRIRYYRTNVY